MYPLVSSITYDVLSCHVNFATNTHIHVRRVVYEENFGNSTRLSSFEAYGSLLSQIQTCMLSMISG